MKPEASVASISTISTASAAISTARVDQHPRGRRAGYRAVGLARLAFAFEGSKPALGWRFILYTPCFYKPRCALSWRSSSSLVNSPSTR
jgi:hypothetical protein